MEIGIDLYYLKNATDIIEYDLLRMLEINVHNGIFVENGLPIHIDGKSINYPKIITEMPDKYSINYEPLINRKISYWLFNRYAILRQMEDSSLKISSFFISKYLNNQEYLYATCRTNRGDFTSHSYTNESVCWVDLIYMMESGTSDFELFTMIDNQINIDRLLQQKEREALKNVRPKRRL